VFKRELDLAALAVPWFANATPSFLYGTLTDFAADVIGTNTDVISGLYDTCSETDGTDGVVAYGHVCMGRLVSYMLQAVATVADGPQSVMLVNSTHMRLICCTSFRPGATASNRLQQQATIYLEHFRTLTLTVLSDGMTLEQYRVCEASRP